MEILHFEDLGDTVSFGFERRYSSAPRVSNFNSNVRGGPERTGPHPPPWVPLLKNLIMVVVSFPTA